jgi:hypothetical protein
MWTEQKLNSCSNHHVPTNKWRQFVQSNNSPTIYTLWPSAASLNVGHVAPQGVTTSFKGVTGEWQNIRGHSNGWGGHRNFSAWIKCVKFKIGSKFLFSALFTSRRERKVILYCPSHILSSGICLQFGNSIVVKSTSMFRRVVFSLVTNIPLIGMQLISTEGMAPGFGCEKPATSNGF